MGTVTGTRARRAWLTPARRRFLRRYWSSAVLVPLGLGLIVAAMFQAKGKEFASTALVTGSALVLMGALHHKVVRAKLPGGAELELTQEARRTTSRLAVRAEPPPAESIGPGQGEDATRWALAAQLFDDLLLDLTGPLEGCSAQLYLYDEIDDLLNPVLTPASPGPSPWFAPGQGVTGLAWERGEYASAAGRAVADDTFLLTDEQKERYAGLTAVAATPVTNAAGRVVAVLSLSTGGSEPALLSDAGFARHLYLAQAVARVLIDLLKWFEDA